MKEVADLFQRVAEIERRLASMIRHGTVSEVDPKKQLVRLRVGGDEEKPLKSPWVPYAQMAGAFKAHIPPSVGQNMTVFAPSGEFRQSVAVPFTWNEANASPSEKGDENVVTFGNVRVEVKGDGVLVSVGGTQLKISGDKVVIKAGTIEAVGETKIGLTAEGGEAPKIITEAGPAQKAKAAV
jgi:phage baseplate assembly protein V